MTHLRLARTALVFIPALLLGTASFGCGPETADDSEAGSAAISAKPVSLQGPVIIGAGVAGARAAYELKQKGVSNITLIAPAKAAPEGNVPDTGLTTTLTLANGGTLDVGASLFPDTYEILDVAKKLGLEFDELGTKLAIVRRGKPVVIDQANSLTLYKLFTPFELTPVKALKTQLELFRLQIAGYNHRDGRLYANESRSIEQYLEEFSGALPARYLSVIPEILGGQDIKTASAGFQQTLFTMNAPHVYTLPQMQQLPLKLIEASGAKVELAKVTKVDQNGTTTTIEGERASGEKITFTTTAPVVVATPSSIASYLVKDAGREERALLDAPMRSVHTIGIELTPGWTRPAGLKGVTTAACRVSRSEAAGSRAGLSTTAARTATSAPPA